MSQPMTALGDHEGTLFRLPTHCPACAAPIESRTTGTRYIAAGRFIAGETINSADMREEGAKYKCGSKLTASSTYSNAPYIHDKTAPCSKAFESAVELRAQHAAIRGVLQ